MMSDDEWPRGIKVMLGDDEEIIHCVHCDRYADASPLAHPACLIVKKGASRPGYAVEQAEDSRVLASAVREFEDLLLHLRSCELCYSHEPCLDRHFLIKATITSTEQARSLARRMAPEPPSRSADPGGNPPADQPTPKLGGESH